MAIMVDKQTGEAVPVTAFLNGDRIANDVAKVNDAARGRFLSLVGMALAAGTQLRSVQDAHPLPLHSTC